MTTPRYMQAPDGSIIPVPTTVPSPSEEEEEAAEGQELELEEVVVEAPEPRPAAETEYPGEDVSDLTSLDAVDMNVLFGTSGVVESGEEEDDLSDLFEVSEEDIMGEEPEAPEPPKKKYRVVPKSRRVIRREPPPVSLGGIQP